VVSERQLHAMNSQRHMLVSSKDRLCLSGRSGGEYDSARLVIQSFGRACAVQGRARSGRPALVDHNGRSRSVRRVGCIHEPRVDLEPLRQFQLMRRECDDADLCEPENQQAVQDWVADEQRNRSVGPEALLLRMPCNVVNVFLKLPVGDGVEQCTGGAKSQTRRLPFALEKKWIDRVHDFGLDCRSRASEVMRDRLGRHGGFGNIDLCNLQYYVAAGPVSRKSPNHIECSVNGRHGRWGSND
jgi:hypothetical protein